MKTKLAQLASSINRIDRRNFQIAYFALVFVISVIMQRPSDGGTGPL